MSDLLLNHVHEISLRSSYTLTCISLRVGRELVVIPAKFLGGQKKDENVFGSLHHCIFQESRISESAPDTDRADDLTHTIWRKKNKKSCTVECFQCGHALVY